MLFHIVLYLVILNQITAIITPDFFNIEIIVVLRVSLETLHESIAHILHFTPDFQYDILLTFDFD
jgi:hypothetical protein